MRLVRFLHQGQPAWGIVEGEEVYLVEGSVYEAPTRGPRVGPLARLKLLAPAEPTKIVAYAGNYKRLITRDGRPLPDLATYEPLLFLKAPTCLIGPEEPVVYPAIATRVQHEPELAFVVKKRARHVPLAEARDYILGFTIANDVTAENVHGRDIHLARSKSFDTFCPCGPFLETDLDTRDLRITLWLNGEVAVDDRTSDRIWDDVRILHEASKIMTLLPGDLVLTGVPMYRSWETRRIKPGDVMEIAIEGLGRLRNPVVAEE